MRIGNAGSRGGPVGADLGVMCDWSRHSEGRASKLGGRSDEWKGHRGDSLDDSSTDTVRCVNGLRTHGAQDRRAPTALGSRVAAVGSLLLLLASLLAGCGDPQPDNGTLVAAVAADRPAEVTVQGHVLQVLPDDQGPEGRHERFRLQVAGQVVEVDHNLTLAPRAPVVVGTMVIVHGQFEPDPGHPVIHYTHHATGAHEGGWIKLDGQRYN